MSIFRCALILLACALSATIVATALRSSPDARGEWREAAELSADAVGRSAVEAAVKSAKVRCEVATGSRNTAIVLRSDGTYACADKRGRLLRTKPGGRLL